MSDLDNIFKRSEKAKLIETLEHELETFDKAVIVLVQDKEDNKYTSLVMSLGLQNTYEAYGILEVAKIDLSKDDS